jgi:hypothetical protein
VVQAVQATSPSLFINVSRKQNLGGRVSAPIEPVHAIYARFKHIRGIPASGGGVSLFKLRVLDTLIDRLLTLRERVPGNHELARLSDSDLEPLIGSLEKRLRAQLLQHKPVFGGLFPETGILIDLAA